MATIEGTEVVTWTGSNPDAQNITIPSAATAVYMFWACWDSPDGYGLLSTTLNSLSPDESAEQATSGAAGATGVAAWYNPSTGSQSLDVEFDGVTDGSVCIVAYVSGGNTTGWRDVGTVAGSESNAVTDTLTTVSGDSVIKFDQRYDIGGSTPPSLSSGWTNGNTTSNNSESARLSYITATGTTQVCDAEDEDYSTIAAISVETVAAGITMPNLLTTLGIG